MWLGHWWTCVLISTCAVTACFVPEFVSHHAECNDCSLARSPQVSISEAPGLCVLTSAVPLQSETHSSKSKLRLCVTGWLSCCSGTPERPVSDLSPQPVRAAGSSVWTPRGLLGEASSSPGPTVGIASQLLPGDITSGVLNELW